MMRHTTWGLVALALVAFLPAAWALDADEILTKAEAKLYNAKKEGLKDVSFEIQSPMFGMMLPGGKLVYYWKAGKEKEEDKGKLKVEGADAGAMAQNPMLDQMLKGMEKGFAGFFGGMVQKEEDKKWTTRTAEEKDGKYVVTVTRKSDAPEGKVTFTKQVLTFSKEYKLEAGSVEAQGQQGEFTLTLVEKEGKTLLGGQKGKQMGMDVEAVIVWQKIDKFWVPQSMTQKLPAQGMEIVFNFAEYKLNKGVDEKIFAGGAPKEQPKEQPKEDHPKKDDHPK